MPNAWTRWLRRWALGWGAWILAVMLPSAALAQMPATPVNGDTRLVTFEFDPDTTYLVLTRAQMMTHLHFRPNERVYGVWAGDSSSFVVEATKDRGHIFVRPKFADKTTSLTVLTAEGDARRSYQIILRATTQDGKWYQRVSWNHQDLGGLDLSDTAPNPLRATPLRPVPQLEVDTSALRAPDASPISVGRGAIQPGAHRVALDRLQLAYVIDGDAEFRPQSVFDDGERTFIRFRPGLTLFPAVFGLTDGGEAQVLNFSTDGQLAIVQGVATQLVLRLGKAEVRVRRGDGAEQRGRQGGTSWSRSGE